VKRWLLSTFPGGATDHHTGEAGKLSNYMCVDDKVLLKDDVYDAQCVGYDEGIYYGSKKLYLRFKIQTLGECFGTEVTMFFNIAKKGISSGSKYYKNWCAVNGAKPSRNAKLSPRLFLNRVFKIKTRTVRPVHNGKEMSEEYSYSVVDEIQEALV